MGNTQPRVVGHDRKLQLQSYKFAPKGNQDRDLGAPWKPSMMDASIAHRMGKPFRHLVQSAWFWQNPRTMNSAQIILTAVLALAIYGFGSLTQSLERRRER
jgi:hypothetical protein